MLEIGITGFNTQLERLSDDGNDCAKAFIRTFGSIKLSLLDHIIGVATDKVLKNITKLYDKDSEEYKILEEDKEIYNLQVTDVKKDDSENKADNYLVYVKSNGKGELQGAFTLSPYSINSKFHSACTWKYLSYLPKGQEIKEMPLLFIGDVFYYCAD